jgi:hypothetical protein
VLLTLDPKMFNTLTVGWQSWFRTFVESLGLEMNAITEVEYSPECNVMRVWVLRLHPETDSPYVDPKNRDEPAHDIFMFFFDKKPSRINLWEWERAMIAYQGDQGA